jgi:hypothetical protein
MSERWVGATEEPVATGIRLIREKAKPGTTGIAEPDIDITTHRARPTSSAVFYLEVLVTAEQGDGEVALDRLGNNFR